MSGGTLDFFTLPALDPETAGTLGSTLAQIDPWARLGYAADALAQSLQLQHPDVVRYLIRQEGNILALCSLRYPWLRGAYIELFAVLPAVQGQGVGKTLLAHLEATYRERTSNLWLLVSGFNHRARRFYASQGFTPAATLEALLVPNEDEVLMRKRL